MDLLQFLCSFLDYWRLPLGQRFEAKTNRFSLGGSEKHDTSVLALGYISSLCIGRLGSVYCTSVLFDIRVFQF